VQLHADHLHLHAGELPGRTGDLLGLEQHALGHSAKFYHAQARRQDRAVGQSQVHICAQEEPAAWLPDDRGRRARYRTRGMAASAGVWVGVGGTEPLAIWLPSSSYENLGNRSGSALILSNHYVVTSEDLQEVPRATTVLTKMRSLRAHATRASVCGFPATRRRL